MNLLDDADYFDIIKIGNNVNICMNVMILLGVKIENNFVIGSGDIVTKSMPDNIVVGMGSSKGY